MASGRPVIAYGRGGATETIVDGKTGLFFHEQSVRGIIAAVKDFETRVMKTDEIVAHAQKFARKHFLRRMREHIDSVVSQQVEIPGKL